MSCRCDVYRDLLEHEAASSAAMLQMVASVPSEAKDDPRYRQILTLAAHIAACRLNWLDRMAGDGLGQVPWWEDDVEESTLAGRYESANEKWRAYLADLDDAVVEQDFTFPIADGRSYRWNIEGQLKQLVGHGNYHLGQVVLLVGQLGGETEDTDYLYWATSRSDCWGFTTGA